MRRSLFCLFPRQAAMTLAGIALAVAAPAGAGEEGLAVQMAWMQTYLHKLDLSVQAGNGELSHFYLHELEEAAEGVVETIEEYDGAPGGRTRENSADTGHRGCRVPARRESRRP